MPGVRPGVCLESGLECVSGVRPGVCAWSQAWNVCLESGLECVPGVRLGVCAWSQAWDVCLESGLECVPGVRPGVCVWSQAWSVCLESGLEWDHRGLAGLISAALSSSWLSSSGLAATYSVIIMAFTSGPAAILCHVISTFITRASHTLTRAAVISTSSTCYHQDGQHMQSSG